MNDELTRLRAIRDAVNKFAFYRTLAVFDWGTSRIYPEYRNDALHSPETGYFP